MGIKTQIDKMPFMNKQKQHKKENKTKKSLIELIIFYKTSGYR